MYSTADEVRQALTPLPIGLNGQDTAATLNDDQLDDMIMQADARIDSYIGGRYLTPVAPLDPDANPATYPAPITYWSRDIAGYLATLTLYRNRPMEATNPAYLRMQQVMADLVAVRDGKAVLALPGASSGDTTTGGTGFAGVVNPFDGDLFGADDFGDRPVAGTGWGWDASRGW